VFGVRRGRKSPSPRESAVVVRHSADTPRGSGSIWVH